MTGVPEQVRTLRGHGAARTVLLLGTAAVWLVLTAIVGAIAVSSDDGDEVAAGPGETSEFATDTTLAGGEVSAEPGSAEPGAPGDPSAQPGSTTPQGGTAPKTGAAQPAPGAPVKSASGGDTTGISSTEIKIGVHAPITFSGVPLNLAEDPIKGIHTYKDWINEHGGINGRKLTITVEDDRFDAEGARASAQKLVNDQKNFMVSGTLGIDQIAIVAAEAAKRGVPYTAAGGDETHPIPGMYQLAANYTTHVLKLAEFMGQDSKYKGKRVGILVSDSQFIRPVAEDFKKALEQHGMKVSTIVENQKPAQNPDYNGYILQFRQANTEVVVPLTDPLTTQQIVQRCAGGAACGWTYSFSNFAHDSDTALTLFAPTWAQQQVRGLSSGCYYMAPEVDQPGKCANMKVAREQWVAAHGQEDWEENGSGGASGYQIIAFLKGALTAPGADLTRERFRGALAAYQGYSDLISGPITFAGSKNTMHGAEKMTVLEAQSNNKFKMISPGLIDGF
jgi:branched-chain amino acid transport system substrate-binding protein